jgi:hypothetical protein
MALGIGTVGSIFVGLFKVIGLLYVMALKFLFVMALIFLFFIPSCSDERGATQLLKSRNYTQIEILEKKWWACGFGDNHSTAFRAKTLSGMQVEGSVCDGMLPSRPIIKFNNQ